MINKPLLFLLICGWLLLTSNTCSKERSQALTIIEGYAKDCQGGKSISPMLAILNGSVIDTVYPTSEGWFTYSFLRESEINVYSSRGDVLLMVNGIEGCASQFIAIQEGKRIRQDIIQESLQPFLEIQIETTSERTDSVSIEILRRSTRMHDPYQRDYQFPENIYLPAQTDWESLNKIYLVAGFSNYTIVGKFYKDGKEKVKSEFVTFENTRKLVKISDL